MTAASYANYGQYLESHGEQLTEYAKFFIRHGSKVTATDYARCLGLVDRLRAQMNDLFEDYDLLLSPTACFPAFPNGKYPGNMSGKSAFPNQYLNGAFTMPINAIGHTAVTVPAGFSSNGLPIGLQITGKKYGEETVIAASAAFERARPWIHHRPPVS